MPGIHETLSSSTTPQNKTNKSFQRAELLVEGSRIQGGKRVENEPRTRERAIHGELKVERVSRMGW